MNALGPVFAILGDGLRVLADVVFPPAPDRDWMPLDEHLATEPRYQQTEPPLSDDELVAVRQLIEDRFGDQLAAMAHRHHVHVSDSSRAVGMQHAAGPGAVSSEPHATPALGHTTDSDLIYEAAGALRVLAHDAHGRIPELIAELRDLAAQYAAVESEPDLSVGFEDLAAHITAIRNAYVKRGGVGHLYLSEEIARDLLANYHITKK